MKGKLALEVDRGDCRGRVGDWVGLGVKGERTRKIESQSFGPEPFENFGTGFYFRSARLALPPNKHVEIKFHRYEHYTVLKQKLQ